MTGWCNQGPNCKCSPDLSLTVFCPNWILPEQPQNDLDLRSKNNWSRIPEKDRQRCLDHLRSKVPLHMRDAWAYTARNGNRIGSSEAMFHFHTGMSIRNTLREIIPDNGLPFVTYESGQQHQNWDDFYFGALYDLVGEA